MQESDGISGVEKTCPFLKAACKSDCMLRMSSADKMSAQCALAILAKQMILLSEKQKKF